MANSPKAWVVRAQTASAQNKKVLAIEGTTDLAVYREWFEKRLGLDWSNRVHLENASDRSTLLKGLQWLQDNNDPAKGAIFGLADRDEWEPDDIVSLKADLPTLLVNETRHSLESFFCDPDELVTILQNRDAATGNPDFTPHLAAFRLQLEAARKDSVPHWALGCTIQRANEHVRHDHQYPDFFRTAYPLPTDDQIKETLNAWAAVLEPNALFNSFDALRTTSLARPNGEQFRACIEPKLFFGSIVVAGQNGLNSIRQQSSDDWLVELARWSPAMPGDLEQVLGPLL